MTHSAASGRGWTTLQALAGAATLIGAYALWRWSVRSRLDGTSASGKQAPDGGARRRRRVAIVSCRELLDAHEHGERDSYGDTGVDDHALHAHLREHKSVDVDIRAWDDASVDWSSYDLVVIRTTWDYSKSEATALRFREWLRQLERERARVCNGTHVMMWNASKRYLQELQPYAYSIPTVHLPAGSFPDLRGILRTKGWPAAILKPCVSAGSRDTFRVDGGDDAAVEDAHRRLLNLLHYGRQEVSPEDADALRARESEAVRVRGSAHVCMPAMTSHSLLLHHASGSALLDAASASAEASSASRSSPLGCDMLLQPFLPGVADGEVSVVMIEGQVMHVVQKVPVDGDFRTQEEFGGVPRPVSVSVYVRAAAEAVLRGALHVVREKELPVTPVTPAMAAVGAQPIAGRSHPCPILIARVDFLSVTPHTHARLAASEAIKLRYVDASGAPYEPSSSSIAASSSNTAAPIPQPPAGASFMYLLELEVIEPCLFFAAGGQPAVRALADAIERLAQPDAWPNEYQR